MSKRFHLLPSAAWVNGGNIQIPVRDLPVFARVRAFVFRLEADFLTGAAAAAIASTQLHRLVSMIDIGPNCRASGAYWRFLDWIMRGGESQLPAGLPATNASHFLRNITWTVPYYDRRAAYPADDLPNGGAFNENVISIDTASFASLDGGTNTWSTLNTITGTLRAYAVLDEANDAPGALVKYGFADLTGQSPNLDPGLYTDLFVYRENCGTIDSTQIVTAAIQADGAAFADQLRLAEYVGEFNRALALGGDLEAASATVPMPGETLPDQPAVTAGAASTVTAPFLPLLAQGVGYKKTGALLSQSTLRIDFTGSDSTFRVGYRKILPRSESAMIQAFQKLGRTDVVSASQISAKTGSKKGLAGTKAVFGPYFPLRALRAR